MNERMNERNDRINTATDWAQVNTTKVRGQAPYVDPAPLDPVAPWTLHVLTVSVSILRRGCDV